MIIVLSTRKNCNTRFGIFHLAELMAMAILHVVITGGLPFVKAMTAYMCDPTISSKCWYVLELVKKQKPVHIKLLSRRPRVNYDFY